ncbi:hypothetical protein Pla110_02920 [Polystyrenella longa]|uniref:Uncharacterized protein n=2 Tax=Polystyrenella longa TaxID=2528007 RepID=A0A518CH85_9PLAN|nr:hypothetical protein Pla110_02920 [Polystyrenella longa]
MQPIEILTAKRDFLESVDEISWRRLVDQLIEEIEGSLGCQIRTGPIEGYSIGKGGFLYSNRRGPLQRMFSRILERDFGSDHYRRLTPCVSDQVLYYDNLRLITRDGKEFAEYIYKPGETGVWRWQLFGWFEDESEEYECFDEP